jgi:hypothetical protein
MYTENCFKPLVYDHNAAGLSSNALFSCLCLNMHFILIQEEEEEEGPFNVLSVNVQHLLGRTVFSSAMLTWRCFLRPDALPDTNTRAVLHE